MRPLNYVVLYWKPAACALVSSIVICLTNKLFALPLTGAYLVAYVVAVCVSSTWLSFVALQNFLQQNRPLSLKLERGRKNDDLSCAPRLTIDIDRYFISKWFVYISNDRTFPEECQELLREVLMKMGNVQLSLDNEAVIHGVLNLYLKHLKEFRRGLKRKKKYGGKISELYRYSHLCSSSDRAKDYYVHQLTINLLNHFINWELSNSLPYRVLVAIVSRKVATFMLNLLSNPDFLNYCVVHACASAAKKSALGLSDYSRVKLISGTCDEDSAPLDVSVPDGAVSLTKVETKDAQVGESVPERTDKTEKKDVEKKKEASIKAEHDETPISKPEPLKFEELKSEEVKVHEPKTKSCKTWYDSYDLDSVTLGQDILDMIGDSGKDLEIAPADHDKDDSSPMTSAKHLLDEVKHDLKQITSMENIRTSMKPISDATVSTINNIKDLQESTVNNVMKPVSHATSTALHKIGGLHLQDEAAGVMEGLLDFGRTKIRKGLRLTGLQDGDVEEPPRQVAQKRNILKMSRVKSVEKMDEVETAWFNPLLQEEPSDTKSDGEVQNVPSILTQTHDDGSPEPEYEEAADLATSIAKLRSLLEQKSTGGSNFSTPALSPMPPEEFSNKLLDGVDESDRGMPSFYKLCAKTATGVINNTLNTIKTALPGNIADRFDGNERWLFVESSTTDNDLYSRMDKLLTERKVFCTVDTAYEAIDSLDPLQHNDKLARNNIQFEDELDDFEVKLPITKALLDVLCELLADLKDTSLAQEPVIKSVLLLFGNSIEETVLTRADTFVGYWCANASIPEETKTNTLSLELEEFVDVVLSGIPDYVKYLVGEKALKHAATLFISSLQVQKINQDVAMQVFEIVCMKLMDGSKQLSPLPT